ncbi:large ribosomal subunit protein mL51 [Pelodiscus sinensis]|uniref:large ribosomal subunit protein mL51 n=1 Tax=Pelodiscus sinensis TaxID=13735 RepID=UPI0003C4A75B|nr:39S ribosomal protein L51, mitochondrial isoform X1 [Pelodiscus sinensis]|eukprot:XP_006124234.1 39S ribosomal protein L51, mitochondrial isoform X1 [Pelodiscus sinensis]
MGTLPQLARWGLLSRSLPLVHAARSLHCGATSMIHVKKPSEPKEVDRWTEKRALFGVYDNIGILGDFQVHPKDLIIGPKWLRGWKGNELQRCIRKKKMVGDRMFDQDFKNLSKRISFLYRRFNRTGKHR